MNKRKREFREGKVDEAWDMLDQIATIFSPNDIEAGNLLTQRFGPDDEHVLANYDLIKEELAEQKRLQEVRLANKERSNIGTLKANLFAGPNARHYAERKHAAPTDGHN
jgi:hypothetical protein